MSEQQEASVSATRTVVTSQDLNAQYEAQAAEAIKQAEKAGDEVAAEENKGAEKPAGKKKPLIDELVRTRHERNAERDRAAQLEKELARLQQQQAISQVQAQQKDADPRPERHKFVSDADFQEALTDWKVDQRLNEQREADQAARAQAAQQQLADQWERNLDAAKQEIPDFDDVVGKSTINLPGYLYTAIVESDVGPKLAYYLSSNPDEARKLMAMTPTTALRVLGKLEDRLEADADAEGVSVKPSVPEKAPEKSKAPPPIEPLKNSSNPADKPTGQMTHQEYRAMRQAQLASKRR